MEEFKKKYNKKLIPLAKILRRNMTDEEKHLWYDYLSKYKPRFYRQKVIGKYIADFYCPEVKLVIELDGSQHFTDKGILSDAERTKYLEDYQIRVIRFKNIRINESFDYVCEEIDEAVKYKSTQTNQ